MRSKNPLSSKDEIRLENLKKTFPCLLMEPGSGRLKVIADAPKAKSISVFADLKREMQLGRTGSIKSYLHIRTDWHSFPYMPSIKELKSGVWKSSRSKAPYSIGISIFIYTTQGEGGLSALLIQF